MVKIQVDLSEKANKIVNVYMALHGIQVKKESVVKLIEEFGEIEKLLKKKAGGK